jgi:hypothetical protein
VLHALAAVVVEVEQTRVTNATPSLEAQGVEVVEVTM